MNVRHFFDAATFTLTFVVSEGTDAVVIDPVLDYDPVASRTSTQHAAEVAAYLEAEGLRTHWILETHAHADHLTAAQWLARKTGARIAIGEGVREVQRAFRHIYALDGLATDGSQFDRLWADGESVEAGALRLRVMATPGHTPGCVTYTTGGAAFVGDALFIEDYGCGRCDFPGGDADHLYTSIHDRIYALPPETRVFPGHDYQPNGRPLRVETTVHVSRTQNVQIRATTTREEFVKMRRERDATLSTPRLMWPSVQVNVDGGRVPAFLKIPVDAAN